jgi:hypothetical protein
MATNAAIAAEGKPMMRHHRLTFLAVGLGVLAFAPAASADLNPPPPDDYSCSANGGGTICRVQRVEHADPVAIEDLCSFTIFDQGDLYQDATRRYDANGNWVERTIRNRWLNSFWSNPATGATIPYTQRSIAISELGVPGDPDTITTTETGENQYTDPVTHKNVLHSAGRQVTGPDGSVIEYSGQQPFLDFFSGADPHAFDQICAALAA